MQDAFIAEAYYRIDRYSRAAITHFTLNRYVSEQHLVCLGFRPDRCSLHSWVMFRVDTLGALFTSSLAVYLTYFSRLSASNTGFSFTMAGKSCVPTHCIQTSDYLLFG